MKKVLALLSISAIFQLMTTPVFALEIPDFSSCTSVNGTVMVSYDSGIHGVPGDGTTYTGRDTVFRIYDTAVLLCLCPEGKTGVQTKWWRYGQLTNDEISVLIKDGWIYVPNGALWGLEDAPYLAKNSNFSCNESGGGSSNSGSSVLGSNTSAGQVLGVSTMAATGNLTSIFGLLFLGTLFIVLAKKLRQYSK